MRSLSKMWRSLYKSRKKSRGACSSPALDQLLTLFDVDWYLAEYPDVAAANVDPRDHFIKFGFREGRMPASLRAVSLERDLWSEAAPSAYRDLRDLGEQLDSLDGVLANWALGRWHGASEEWSLAATFLTRICNEKKTSVALGHLGPELLLTSALCEEAAFKSAQRVLDQASARFGWGFDLALSQASLILAHSGDTKRAGEVLSGSYLDAGLSGVLFSSGEGPALDRLQGSAIVSPTKHVPGSQPLVSVIVPAFNADRTLEISLRSLAEQTWRELEIIVVNDASQDRTAEVASEWSRLDPRVSLVNLKKNEGPYISRNAGLAICNGAFITVQDADDWSHPEKIERQIVALIENTKLAANMSCAARVTNRFRPRRWRMEQGWVDVNLSSLMLRREAHEELGFWDRVRFGGDAEFLARFEKRYGSNAIEKILPGVPLAFCRSHSGSLTQKKASHAVSQLRGNRHSYIAAAQRWHASMQSNAELRLEQFPNRRRFYAPPDLCVGDEDPPASEESVLRESAYWDERWYLAHYSDVRRSNWDALAHFLERGADEGRDPGPRFSTSGYKYREPLLKGNPVIAAIRNSAGTACSLSVLRHKGELSELGTKALVCAHLGGKEIMGAERGFLEILDRLKSRGHACVATLPAAFNRQYVKDVLRRCHELYVLPYGWLRYGYPPTKSSVEIFCEILAAHEIAEVHVNTLTLDIPLLAAKRCRLPCVVHVRELPADNPGLCAVLGATAAELRSFVLNFADNLVANSPLTAEWLDAWDRTEVWPIQVDRELYELPFEPAKVLRVGMIGSNAFDKGIREFCAVARLCLERGLEMSFVLVGPTSADLDELRPLPKNIVETGYIHSPVQAISKCDILLNLSVVAESFGRTVLEAMRAGRPVIASKRGMPARLVRDGETGYLVDAADCESIFQRLHCWNTTRGSLLKMSLEARTAAALTDESRSP